MVCVDQLKQVSQIDRALKGEGCAAEQLTFKKVSPQIRDRTFRMALVPLSSRPTLQDRTQQSTVEQDYRRKEKEGRGEKERRKMSECCTLCTLSTLRYIFSTK